MSDRAFAIAKVRFPMHFCKFRYKKQGLHYSGGSIFNMAVGPKVEILLSEIFNFYGKIFFVYQLHVI